MKYNVQKSTTINASLSRVREFVEDFNHWNSWSPWTVIEPSCPISVSGNANEAGHCMRWNGDVIGSGENTLISSDSNRLNYDLEFFKPWKSKAQVSFLFEDIKKMDTQTKVTWTMNSSMPLFLFFMIKTMKNWIGMDYDRGLRMLKEVCENGSVKCTTTNEGLVEYKGFSYVGIERTVSFSDIPYAMKKDFEKLVKDIVVNAQKGAKHWLCIYPKFDIKNMRATYIAAVSDEGLIDLNLGPEYIKGHIDDSRMLEIQHKGSYDFLGNAWSMGMMYMRSKKYKSNAYPFEQYWNNPMETAPDELSTSIYFPIT